MRNEEIKAELEALRAEVLALAETRKQTPEPTKLEGATEEVAHPDKADTSGVHEAFAPRVKELVELLETELRETPVVSGLVIFSLGLLVGRFLR